MARRTWYFLSVLFLSYAALLFPGNDVFSSQGKNVQQSWSDFFAMQLEPGEIGYMCLGVHSNVALRLGGRTILFDPSILTKHDLESLRSRKIDLVVYTHDHGDHFDKTAAKRLFEDSASSIVAERNVAKALQDVVPEGKLFSAESGQPITVGDVRIDPLKGKHIGPIMLFRVAVDEITVVHAGDSDHVPLKTMNAAIAFVPTGSPSPTCSPKKAFKMVVDIEPQYAVAFHGDIREHKKFEKLVRKKLPGINVIIPEPYAPLKLTVQ